MINGLRVIHSYAYRYDRDAAPTLHYGLFGQAIPNLILQQSIVNRLGGQSLGPVPDLQNLVYQPRVRMTESN